MKRIVLTGGDASGKSTVWQHVKETLGSFIQPIPEIFTALTSAVPGGHQLLPKLGEEIDIRPDVLGYFQDIIRPMQYRAEDLWAVAARMNNRKACLLDRGIPDLVAYDPGGWPAIEQSYQMTKQEIFGRYTMVIILRSLAVRNPEMYQQVLKSNPSRVQRTVEEAVALDEQIRQAWEGHPNLILLDDDIEVVKDKVVELLLATEEVERKFDLGSNLPLQCRMGDIVAIKQRQCYATSRPGEIRFRHEQTNGKDFYFITVKSDGNLGRMEWEKEIPRWVFEQNWNYPGFTRVVKVRRLVSIPGGVMEVDLYEHPDIRVIAEVEFDTQERASAFVLPEWMEGKAIEVTNDRRFKAKEVAANGFPGKVSA